MGRKLRRASSGKKGSSPVASNQTPKKKSMPDKKSANSDVPALGANNNVTVRGDKKKKPKKHHVSFDGNKDGQRTSQRPIVHYARAGDP